MNSEKTPNFKLKLIQSSSYSFIGKGLNVAAIILFILCSIVFGGKAGRQKHSAFQEALNISNNIMFVFVMLIPASLLLFYWAYRIDRKFIILGDIFFSSEQGVIIVITSSEKHSHLLSEIKKMNLDISNIKDTISISSIKSSGSKNYISIELENRTITYEILIESEKDLLNLKDLMFFHTTTYRK